jgi:chromosomal replication initiator protein
MTDLWQAALGDLETKVSAHNFESWFKNINFHHQDDSTAHLEVADEFFKAWIEENYLDLIEESLRSVSGQQIGVVIGIRGAFSGVTEPGSAEPGPQPPRGIERAQAQGDMFAPSAPPEAPSVPARPVDFNQLVFEAGLNPRYTFDEFVVGPSNQFTHAACVSIARNPGKNYNPLFIFGGVGLGKTHLLQAVGIEILRKRPDARIVTLSSEEFMNQLITSLRRQKDMSSFRAQFRDGCDVLLIDDIQFIGGKDSTQEEFFHTFNALYHSGKQIVMTSDKSPKELPGVEERLRSRFSWGLIADVQIPEMETRLAILKKKAETDGIDLADDVGLLLASSVRSNVRELEGTLVRLGAQAEFMRTPITIEMAREYLTRMNFDQSRQITVDRIIALVSEHFGITSADIKGARRTRAISEPRQLAMYLSRKHTEHSYPELGRKFGGKDHTTVLAACRKLEKLLKENDATTITKVRDLEQLLER